MSDKFNVWDESTYYSKGHKVRLPYGEIRTVDLDGLQRPKNIGFDREQALADALRNKYGIPRYISDWSTFIYTKNKRGRSLVELQVALDELAFNVRRIGLKKFWLWTAFVLIEIVFWAAIFKMMA